MNTIQNMGIYGVFLLIFIYIIATISLFPPFTLSLAGGFIYGYWALIIDIIGAVLGTVAAFLLGKSLFRSFIEKKIKEYPKFEVIDKIIETQGLKIVILLRLCPLFPDSLMSYFLAMTKIPLITFIFGTIIGMIPGTCFLVYLGNSAKSLKEIFEGKVGISWKVEIILFLISGILIVGFFLISLFTAQNILRQIVKEQEDKMNQEEIMNEPSIINEEEEEKV